MDAKQFLQAGGSIEQLSKLLNHVFINKQHIADFKEALVELGKLKPTSKATIRTTHFNASRLVDGRYIEFMKLHFIDGRNSYIETLYLHKDDYKLLDVATTQGEE